MSWCLIALARPAPSRQSSHNFEIIAIETAVTLGYRCQQHQFGLETEGEAAAKARGAVLGGPKLAKARISLPQKTKPIADCSGIKKAPAL
jgi:hypothetical protein